MRMAARLGTAVAAVVAFVLAGAGAAGAAPATSSGGEQCERPVSARTGNWFCPERDPAAVLGFAAAAVPEHCNESGCYRRYDDFRADFRSVRGAWGIGPRVLGHHEHEVAWQLTGSQMRAKPVFYENTVDTVDVVFTGDLLNAAPGKPGTPVEGAFNIYTAGDVPAGVRRAWRPNGFKSYDDDNFDHVQVIQFSWRAPGYDGYWYAYVKSPNATSPGKDVYRFRDVDQLPADPFGGGYRI